MSNINFIQKTELFTYSGTNCIRNDYYHNDCQLCVEICPQNAFHIVRNKMTLFANECIECAACIGSCPTEALSIISFDPNAYTASFKESEEKLLSCKKTTSCLGAFDAYHYSAMALQSSEGALCDLSHCDDCALNKDKKVEEFIRFEINKANNFLEACGVENIITIQEEKPEENAKRMLFKSAFAKVKSAAAESEVKSLSMTRAYQKNNPGVVPLKFLQFKKAIRENISKISKTSHNSGFGLFTKKEISFTDCTNCGDCSQFCPTGALITTSNKQGINFNIGNCISCEICNDICKANAIKNIDAIDLVDFAYDRGIELVYYEMVMCHECRCPYPYRGGDPICHRCADFKLDFSHVFTMAKDL